MANNKTKNNSRQVETDACCTFCGDDNTEHLISSVTSLYSSK